MTRSGLLVEHDLVGKPVSTFPDHAPKTPVYTTVAERGN